MDRRARSLAWVAALLGAAHAAVSAYWALGGTRLLDTVGGSIEDVARDGGVLVRLGLGVVILLKLVASAAGLLAVARPRRRLARAVAWTAAVVLVLYGGVLTVAGLLVQADVVHAAADADQHALAWHAYFWDPWFLLWGLVLGAALLTARRAGAERTPSIAHHRGS